MKILTGQQYLGILEAGLGNCLQRAMTLSIVALVQTFIVGPSFFGGIIFNLSFSRSPGIIVFVSVFCTIRRYRKTLIESFAD